MGPSESGEVEERLWGCEACHEEWTAVEATVCPKCGAPGFALDSKACPSCGGVIRGAARLCRICQTPLATVVCNSCGTTISADVAHCTVCGAEKGAEAPPATPEPLYMRRYGEPGEKRAERPLLVVALGLPYALIGVSLILVAFALGSLGVKELRSMGVIMGLLLFGLPGVLTLLVGLGFFARARSAHGGALLLAVVGLLVSAFIVVVRFIGVVGDFLEPAQPTYYGATHDGPSFVLVLLSLNGALLTILTLALLVLVLLSKEVSEWFGSA